MKKSELIKVVKEVLQEVEREKWNDPYLKDSEVWEYEPTEKEIEDFERVDKGLPPILPPKPKPKYTGRAALQVKVGLDRWENVEIGSVAVIKSMYKKQHNKGNYRIIYEKE